MEETFVKELICSIVKSKDMPKVQVEREFSPILEIFIESAMNELAKNKVVWEGEYKLIAPEFPLNNEEDGNLRSVNIDYLLVNSRENYLVFVELKTDSHSFETEQYDLYKRIIEKKDTKNLYHFLSTLQHKKYKNYKEIVDEKLKKLHLDGLKNINDIKLIYIAPAELTKENKHRGNAGKEAIKSLMTNSEDEKFVTFADLEKYNSIEHDFIDEWKIITKELKNLDDN
jgi:hypothetical protein